MFTPIQDRVLVKPSEPATKTASGIVIPDNVQQQNTKGVVVKIGPGRTLKNGTIQALAVKEGDTVLYGKYSGSQVKVDGVDYVVLKEDDILGIVEV